MLSPAHNSGKYKAVSEEPELTQSCATHRLLGGDPKAHRRLRTPKRGTNRGTLRKADLYLADSKEWLKVIYAAIVLLESVI
jgi:hypothetical protein